MLGTVLRDLYGADKGEERWKHTLDGRRSGPNIKNVIQEAVVYQGIMIKIKFTKGVELFKVEFLNKPLFNLMGRWVLITTFSDHFNQFTLLKSSLNKFSYPK